MLLQRLGIQGLFGALLLATASGPLHSAEAGDTDEGTFDGFYLGAALTSQNVWGGSLIGGIDVLSEDRRSVAEVSLGWRHGIFENWVVGVEVQAGLLDGDLRLETDSGGLAIDYANDSQFGFGVNVGRILGPGRRHLLYAHAYETKRDFDVTINHPSYGVFTQSDEQGFLRYGLTLETTWSDRLRTKLAVGTYRVDFGDALTNIDIGSDLDISIGLVFRLGSRHRQ
jgi:hypothetical protein